MLSFLEIEIADELGNVPVERECRPESGHCRGGGVVSIVSAGTTLRHSPAQLELGIFSFRLEPGVDGRVGLHRAGALDRTLEFVLDAEFLKSEDSCGRRFFGWLVDIGGKVPSQRSQTTDQEQC